MISRTFVVNLLRSRDRRQGVRERLARAGFDKRDVEFFRAVDAFELSSSSLKRLGVTLFPTWKQLDSNNSFYSRDLKLGEVGCSLSHYYIWQRIAESGYEAALIVEDDVSFSGDARARIDEAVESLSRAVPEWELCYIGRKRLTDPTLVTSPPPEETRISASLVVPTFSYCTHAYAVSKRGAAKLLASGIERALIPVDEFLPALYARHPRADVREVFGPGDRLRAFAIDPSLAFQVVEQSETEASAFIGAGESGRKARGSKSRAKGQKDDGPMGPLLVSDAFRLATRTGMHVVPQGADGLVLHVGSHEIAARGDTAFFLRKLLASGPFLAEEATKWTNGEAALTWSEVVPILESLAAAGVIERVPPLQDGEPAAR